jgi:hypothetical protein
MKDDIADRAQLIIKDVMPTKILQLNNLFKVCVKLRKPLHVQHDTFSDVSAVLALSLG